MKKLGYLIIVLLLSACWNEEKTTNKTKEVENVNLENDTTKLNETSVEFLFWYKSNYDKLNNLKLVDNADLESLDSTKYYSVNFKNVDTYLSEFKNSGFVTNNFIDNELKNFKESDNYLKENPQFDGPPVGLDYDRIVYSPEIIDELITRKTIKSEVIKVDKNFAVVQVELNYQEKLLMTFKKEKGKWKIENITPKKPNT